MRPTRSGWALLSIGLAVFFSAYLINLPGLRGVGLLAMFLPLGSAVALWLRRNALDTILTARPHANSGGLLWAGYEASADVQTRNISFQSLAPIRLSLVLPYEFGGPVDAELPTLRPGEEHLLRHQMVPSRRGVFTIGPLTAEEEGPFGLVRRRYRLVAPQTVTVAPKIHPLRAVNRGIARRLAEDYQKVNHGTGIHDFSPREYRHGDDMRFVHWSSTARHGELMVRQEANAEIPRITVFLDCARSSYPDSRGGARFEWMVSAAASIGRLFLSSQYEVVLLSQEGTLGRFGPARDSTAELAKLQYLLATLQPGRTADPAPDAAILRREPKSPLSTSAITVGLFGSHTAQQRRLLDVFVGPSRERNLNLLMSFADLSWADDRVIAHRILRSENPAQAWDALLRNVT